MNAYEREAGHRHPQVKMKAHVASYADHSLPSSGSRILVVTQYFWPESFRINDVALGLAARGHKITVLTGQPNYPAGKYFPGYGGFRHARENFQGIDIIRVPLIRRGDGGGLRLALNYLSFAVSASILGILRCKGSFDLILVYEPSPVTVGIPALILKKIKNTPIFFWVQDLWPESLSATGSIRSPFLLSLVGSLVRYIYFGCDRILVQSRAFFDLVERLGVPRQRIAYFPNSAEPVYRPITIEPGARELSQLPKGFRVMFAGNIGAAQDFETILAASEKLTGYPDIHWVILGDGRMAPWVAEQVRQRGLSSNVHLLGHHPVEAMPRYFALADAMLVTLRRDPIFSLTIPAKVQSYLACAKPIVAGLDGEGARVVTESGAGFAVPAEDPAALAEAVLQAYLLSSEERAEMGRRGRAYFACHFEREMLLDRLEAWMNDQAMGGKLCES